MADGRKVDPRRVALRTLKTAAALGDRLRAPEPGVVVLIYHRVGERGDPSEIDLPADVFDRQMAWLAETGRVVTLDAALDLLTASDADSVSGPGQATKVVVTFDDGTADLADVALPILARHGVPATVYVATRFIDEQLPWPAGGVPLSWAGAREMVDSGLVTIGSHTHGHRLLDRLSPSEAADELDRSRDLIEDRLGVAAHHFAYPKAVAPSDPAVEAEVRRRFRSAALGGNRPNRYGATDAHRLNRTAIQVSDGITFFRRKAAGGMALEDGVRRALNRVRYRAAAH
jgi:peptidoglycan/xylan/chitin deacetylase (PgdA/CDA1 family)